MTAVPDHSTSNLCLFLREPCTPIKTKAWSRSWFEHVQLACTPEASPLHPLSAQEWIMFPRWREKWLRVPVLSEVLVNTVASTQITTSLMTSQPNGCLTSNSCFALSLCISFGGTGLNKLRTLGTAFQSRACSPKMLSETAAGRVPWGRTANAIVLLLLLLTINYVFALE